MQIKGSKSVVAVRPEHKGLSFGLQTFEANGPVAPLFEYQTFPPHPEHWPRLVPEVPLVPDGRRRAAVGLGL